MQLPRLAGRIGVIKYMSKYISSDTLGQMYELCRTRPHLDYVDKMYYFRRLPIHRKRKPDKMEHGV